jgi:hypothetical protein
MTPNLYQTIALSWLVIGLLVFIVLLNISAPYGRHNRSGWGPQVDNKLGWILMELVVLLVLSGFLWTSQMKPQFVTLVILSFFYLHYIHRSLIFPFFIRTKGKKMPLAIMLSAVGFNSMNGFLLGWFFTHLADYPDYWLTDSRFIFGTMLFFAGMAINIRSDYYLIGLRKPGQTGYVLPQKGLFRWMSCPNHFGEILEWTGFAILTWSLPGLVFAVWTFANLAPRARAHHFWYLEKFPDYPMERRILIPFIW